MTLAMQDEDLEFDGATPAVHQRTSVINPVVPSVQCTERNNNCHGGRLTNINDLHVQHRHVRRDDTQRTAGNPNYSSESGTRAASRRRIYDDDVNFISLPVECSGNISQESLCEDNVKYFSSPSSPNTEERVTFNGYSRQSLQTDFDFLEVDQDTRNTVRSIETTPESPNIVHQNNSDRFQTRERLNDDLPSVVLTTDGLLSSICKVDSLPSVDLDVLFPGNKANKRLKSSGISFINDGLQNLNLRSSQNTVLPQKDNTPYWSYILKPDAEGDSLLFAAILDKRTSLALEMINLLPEHTLLTHINNLRQSALHLAALTDNHVLARRLVVAGAKVHLQDQNGNTPLHIAAMRGNVKMAEALLSPVRYAETLINSFEIPYQAIPQDLDIRNYQGQTCIVLATLYRHPKFIDILLDKDANINTVDMKTGKTCLHIAAESGDLEIVEFITSKPRVNIDAETYSGYTAVEIANFRNHRHVVYALCHKGASEPRTFEDESEYMSDD